MIIDICLFAQVDIININLSSSVICMEVIKFQPLQICGAYAKRIRRIEGRGLRHAYQLVNGTLELNLES